MKAILYLIAGSFLVSFSSKSTNGSTAMDGLWTGAYRTDSSREKVLVRFEAQNQLELYNGDVEDKNKASGTYEVKGDSLVVFNYVRGDGKQITMQGHINKKKTYLDGVWITSDNSTGSFYLKKEKIQELYIQP